MGSLATSVTNNTGGYSATGAYSVEFLSRVKYGPNISLGEYFFLLGLSRMDHTFTYNVSVTPTYNGAQVVDNGNGISQISLSGEIYAHYTGKPVRKPMPGLAGVGNALLGELEDLNPIKKAGYLDFFDLVYLMQEARDKEKFKSRVPTFSSFYPNAFDIYSVASAFGTESFNSEDIQMVFHDYDRDSHWEVAFDKNGFKISQSKEDPHTWYWNLNFIGVKDESARGKNRRAPLPDLKQMVSGVLVTFEEFLSDLSGPLSYLKGITELYTDIANLAEGMKDALKSFEATNKESLRAISKAGGPLKKKTNQFQELLMQSLFPNQTVPSIGALDIPIVPVSTTSSQAEIDAQEIPNSVLDNVLTSGAVSDFEIEAAVDPAVLSVLNIQIALGTISTVLMLANNENLAQNSSYIKVKPGETLEILARKYFGSPDRIDLLIQNDPRLIGKSNEEIIEMSIKVPTSVTYNQRDTGVYLERYLLNNLSNSKTQELLEEFLFGEDIALKADRDIETKGGDISTTKGIDCLVDGLLDKMRILPGQIPMHPDIGALPKPGSVPDDFLNLVIPKKILDDIQSDLGVQTADIVEFSIDSDAISYIVKVNPIGDFKSFKLRRVRGLIE